MEHIDNFVAILQDPGGDELVSLYFDHGVDGPYYVQRTVLEEASNVFFEFFQHLEAGGDEMRIDFQEDPGACKVFLCWLLGREDGPPDFDDIDDRQVLLLKCWEFGKEWSVRGFQDVVMFLLLEFLDTERMSEDAIIYGFQSGYWVLKDLAAEELVRLIIEDGNVRPQVLGEVADEPDALHLIAQHFAEYRMVPDFQDPRRPRMGLTNRWRDYMVRFYNEEHGPGLVREPLWQ